MKLIEGRTIPEVWTKAARYLQDSKRHEDYDLVLHITHPVELSVEDSEVINLVDELLKVHGGGRIHTVAETIFPISDYVRNGRDGVFRVYPERMDRIHASRKDKRWGCYAMRMLRQTDLEGVTFNPLEKIIEKMSAARRYKACYELVPGRPFLDEVTSTAEVATYDPATDRNPYYGNLPCLSLASFKYDNNNNQVRLNATYRSHYYIQRTLGNLIGLGRLLYFVAREAGAEIGPLTINSTYATLDTGKAGGGTGNWNRKDITELIAKCESTYESADKELADN